MEKDWLKRNIGPLSTTEQKYIKNSKILVCGLGGVGGICAELLVRSGLGSISVIDSDSYEPTNINRQIQCTNLTLGVQKADVFKNHAKTINPDIDFRSFSSMLSEISKESYLHHLKDYSPNLIIDAFDNACARVLVYRLANKLKIPYLYSACSGSKGMISLFDENINLEKILNLPTYNNPEAEVTTLLNDYPTDLPAYGPATNLTGAFAANAALNFILKKTYPKAPEFWFIDPLSTNIFEKKRLS
jgi:molybdopterin-synthase adenylyltransferase